MRDTTIIIFGIAIIVKYRIHDRGYVEWYLYMKTDGTPDHTKLLELLLRTNHAGLVESLIRESEYYEAEAAARGHSSEPPF